MTDVDWFRTLAPIVFPSAVIERAMEVESIAELDFEPGCQSVVHETGPWHSGDSAEYMQYGPCEHTTGLRCAGWVQTAMAQASTDLTGCGQCGTEYPFYINRYVPISASS